MVWMSTFKWQMLNVFNSVVFHVDRWINRHQEYPRHLFFARMNVYEAYTNYNHEMKHLIKAPLKYFVYLGVYCHVKWVPVTTAWRVLRLRMEERPLIWRVAANKLNKQARTTNEEWSSSLGVGRGANNASP
jgi:hypothetical protein